MNECIEKFEKLFEELDSVCLVEKDGEKKEVSIYGAPLFGFASAEDTLFDDFKKDGVVGPWYKAPKDWLPDARTVISVFLPFSDEVKKSNAAEDSIASLEWAYARVEGQAILERYMDILKAHLESEGLKCRIPSQDPEFFQIVAGRRDGETEIFEGAKEDTFSSCWSERHAAFAAGLGTFGLSRGIITEKGMAGRFGSIVVDGYFEPTERKYKDIYEYCIKCGACSKRCPVNAIPVGELKNHMICAPVVAKSKQLLAPRYGCGLCQTKVPCMSQIPKRV